MGIFIASFGQTSIKNTNSKYMKRYSGIAIGTIAFFGLLFTYSLTQAQQMQTSHPNVKKIEVTGSAEIEVTPDEIYFNIALREYFKDKDKNKNKVDIQTLEKQLQAAVNAAGIPKENFQIENIYGNRWYWQEKKKPVEFLESKRYVLKLSTLSKIDEILSKVDAMGIEYVNISRYEHSQIEQIRRDIKIKALQAAREKAAYLLAGINQQIGNVLEVQELGGTDQYYPVPYAAYSRASNEAMNMKDGGGEMQEQAPEIDFKKIKIRYEMRAVYEIK